VAEYVFENGPPPPVLSRAFSFKGWGVNILDIRAEWMRPMNAAYNLHRVLSDYRNAAPRAAAWANKHPDAYAVVSGVLQAMRQGWPDGSE